MFAVSECIIIIIIIIITIIIKAWSPSQPVLTAPYNTNEK